MGTNDAQIERQTLTKYLVANGYAVMYVNGLPKTFCEKYGVNFRNNIGSPIAVKSYVNGYRFNGEKLKIMTAVEGIFIFLSDLNNNLCF